MTPDTLFFATSTGKGVATSVAHVLVERGELSYEQRVADVWPEFGAHGKDGVTLRDVLVHAAGVPGLWPDITPEDLGDWDRVCAFIADQRPWWPAGHATGYHALTFGFVLGEFVRRATGRTLAARVARGDRRAARHRRRAALRRSRPAAATGRPAGSRRRRTTAARAGIAARPRRSAGVQPTAAFANRPDVLRADIPAQGTMSARAAARMYAALLGHIDGVELVSPNRLREMAAPAFSGIDQVMGFPTHLGAGLQPARLGGVESRPGSTFGMAGSNGSAAYADIDSGVAVAVMRNRIVGDMSAVAAIDQMVADDLG